MTHFFTEDEVAQLLTMEEAIAAVERAFHLLGEGGAVNRPRTRVRVERLMLHVMAAGADAFGHVGLKAYTTGPSGARFYFLMFDASTGELVAVMEADRLGQIRTGAASGVATRYMARENAQHAAIYGTGWQARSQLEAVVRVRPIRSVAAYSRNEERRRAFCEEMTSNLGIPVEPRDAPDAAGMDADVIITATNARAPVLKGEWLRPGQHVNAVGSNVLKRLEIDELSVTRANFIATDSVEQARIECGDLAAVVEAGKLSWDQVHELADVVRGAKRARRDDDAITLFESQGLAIEDVAVGQLVYEKGLEKGLGRLLPL